LTARTPSLTRRAATASLLAAPALATGIARAADPVRTVKIAGFDDWFREAFEGRVLPAFRKANPGIATDYTPLGNSIQAFGLLRGQSGRPSTDVVLMEAGVAAFATGENLLTKLGQDTVPAIKDLIPAAVLPNVAGPGLYLDSLALAYSPGAMPKAPRTWRNLWDPAYGQRIGLTTPPDPAALAMTAVAGALFGGEEFTRGLELGVVALQRLRPRVTAWDPVPEIYSAITFSDISIGPAWNARAQYQAAQYPGRFAAIVPEDGSPYQTVTVNLAKNAPNRDAALTLINWLLAPEGQRLLTEQLYLAPVNSKADIPAPALARAGAAPADVAKRMAVDWHVLVGVRDQIGVAWRKLGLARS
jgi:putative spermidine/putrescine transport system substrate-binding protein